MCYFYLWQIANSQDFSLRILIIMRLLSLYIPASGQAADRWVLLLKHQLQMDCKPRQQFLSVY